MCPWWQMCGFIILSYCTKYPPTKKNLWNLAYVNVIKYWSKKCIKICRRDYIYFKIILRPHYFGSWLKKQRWKNNRILFISILKTVISFMNVWNSVFPRVEQDRTSIKDVEFLPENTIVKLHRPKDWSQSCLVLKSVSNHPHND